MSARLPLRWLLTVVFVSGAAALATEIVWARMLHRVVGSGAVAVASVVAGVLGGLGAGAWIAERRWPRSSSPLRAYAGAELAALGATVTFPVVAAGAGSFLALPGGAALPCILTAIFAAPWGASFPFLMSALSADGARARDLALRVRSAYGWNAVGGAAGGLTAGLILIPGVGEWGTVACSAALEALAVLGALVLAPRFSPSPAEARAVEQPPVPSSGPVPGDHRDAGTRPGTRAPRLRPTPLAFLLLSGLVVIYWEVLWTRILVLVVGGTVYSFAVMSSGVVLGIGLGSLLSGGRWIEERAGWLLPLVVAALGAACYALVPFLPEAYLAGVRLLGLSPLVSGCLGAGAIVLVPSVLLGGLFPWVVAPRIEAAGRCYAVNSAGSILGAFLGGPIAATALAIEDAYLAGIAALALLAAIGAILPPSGAAESRAGSSRAAGRLAVLVAAASILAGAAILVLWPGPPPLAWDPRTLLSGVYQWSREDLRDLSLETSRSSREIVSLERGREVIVTVEVDRPANTVYVRGNGKVEGGVPLDPSKGSLADLPTQLILGAVPALLRGGGGRPAVLLIGLGSGVTLGELAAGGHIREAGPSFVPEPSAAPGGGVDHRPSGIDVVEIEEAFLRAIRSEAARQYVDAFVPGAVLGVPGSPPDASLASGAIDAGGVGDVPVRFHFGDARRLLVAELRDRRWDAIVSQPSEPWIPGSASLFTLEFFEIVARRLQPGGFLVQWLQLYKLDEGSVQLLLRTFRRVFPEVLALRPPGTGELILVGSMDRIDVGSLLGWAPEARLRRIGIEVPADFLAMVILGPRGVDRWVGFSPADPVNTDSRSEIVYAAARALYSGRDLAQENLDALRALGGGDPVSRYLPSPLSRDAAFLRGLASRNVRLGDLPEARAILAGDDSEAARAILAEIERLGAPAGRDTGALPDPDRGGFRRP